MQLCLSVLVLHKLRYGALDMLVREVRIHASDNVP